MSPPIEAFAENAKLFCHRAESSTHDVEAPRQLLLALMQGIPSLKSPAPREGAQEYPHRHEDWKSDHKRFADFPVQYYWIVSTTCELDEEALVAGDVHDDLADIYGELWQGCKLGTKGIQLTRQDTGTNPILSTGAITHQQPCARLMSITGTTTAETVITTQYPKTPA